jgi:hypothetical protein
MRGRQVAYHAVSIACIAMACASVAMGHVTALHVVSEPAPEDILPGYVVNDLLIDFTGQYNGSQMTVELTSGSIYQNPLGGTGPPIAALFLADPTVEWDTFLSNGGATAETTIGNFGFGGSQFPCPNCFPIEDRFTEELIDQTWFPAHDNEIVDQTGFMVARVTLSGDATGTFQYLGGPNNVIGVAGFPPEGIVSRPIRNGFIIPEPTTVALLAVGLAVAVAAHRSAYTGLSS